MDKIYDLLIIGTGPAGYAAAIYASRYRLDQVIIGKVPGGLISEAHRVCNFPGLPDLSGLELTAKFREHLKSLNVEEVNDFVTEAKKENEIFKIKTQNGNEFQSKAIIIAIGTKRRKLGLENEEKYKGKGVSYCSTCDGGFFKDKVVSVVGGSDAANTSSIHLAKLAKKVYQIYRKDKLRGEPAWANQVTKNPKIEVIYNANVIELIGNEKLESVKLDTGQEVKTDGLFIEIGSEPDTTLMKQLNIDLDEGNYIKVDSSQKTNVEGIWAAGDITDGSNGFRQVVTACAEAAIAVEDTFKYLQMKN